MIRMMMMVVVVVVYNVNFVHRFAFSEQSWINLDYL